MCDSVGSVQERYAYSAYGVPYVLTAAFVSRAGSYYDWETRFAAYRWDAHVGFFHVRNRMYHPVGAIWGQRDPAGYGRLTNLYAYCSLSPLTVTDPTGLADVCDVAQSPITNCICTGIQLLDTAFGIAAGMGITLPLPWGPVIEFALDLADCLCDILSIFSLGCCGGALNFGEIIGMGSGAGSCIVDLFDAGYFLSGIPNPFQIQQAIAEFITYLGSEIGPDVAGNLGTVASCVDALS